ncbi:hypothetical protein ACTXLW_02260 [Psychrobacter celer]|uniref:hypothetical protein n=1 Tax=Psychrobacter celer TaxID=306572 RepID=UPI003FD43B26
MSSTHSNHRSRQSGCRSQLHEVTAPVAIYHKNKHRNLSRTLTATGCALLLGGTSLVLMGCQTSAGVSSGAVSDALIDFEVADSAVNQAQGRVFTDRLQASSARYEKLFDQQSYPNTETQAKTRLLAAIRQHLASEHVAVAQANYHMAPFIDPDSIDAGASSLLRTIIETYAYQEEQAIDDEAADDNSEFADRSFADDADEAFADDDEYSANTKDDGLIPGVQGVKPKALLKSYEAMQAAKQQPVASDDKPMPTTGVIGQMLAMLHRTPEQIAATNAYQYQHLTFNSVSQFRPKQRQLRSVYSYDYVSPTLSSSIQIPLALDFNDSRITVDPSAIMPIVALASPENTPLPQEMASHTVSFGLPKSITEQLPPTVLYDAALAAIQKSMAELAPEYFSAVDIRNDAFAKEVGASHAVKLYIGSKQGGELVGKILKYMTQSLQEHVDANPSQYPDGAMLKAALAKAQLYHKGYQSADVGALLQLIEAIGPISFNQTNYYYLDRANQLLAKQQRLNVGSDLMGATTSVLNQVRYDKASFNDHALTPLLAESFGANAKPAIDGNAWLAKIRQQKDRLRSARYARYDYEYDDENRYDVDNTDEEGGVYDSGNSEDWNDNDEALYDDAAKYGIDSKLADQ